jgi:PKD repeat protein
MFGDCPIKRIPSILLLALVHLAVSGCDSGQAAAPAPTPASPQPSALTLTCAVGTADCSTAMLGQTVTFTAQRGDTVVRSATLDFGDGTPGVDFGALTVAASASHEYTRLGAFTARLDVTTTSGDTRSATQAIRVDTRVTASMEAVDLGGLNVLATADVQGAPVARYEWTFDLSGAVVTTTSPRANYTYSAAGFKDLQLRAILSDGRTIRASTQVIVE